MQLILKSPAKINLFLRILRKREDGYHELASLFQAIDLADTLHFEHSDKDHFTCTNPKLPLDHSNLVIKALNLFRRNTGIDLPLAIHLEKNIPCEAGLGGGSSNAATTLWACNQLAGTPATDTQLAQWGAEIGSDVAFFLSLGTAYCTGRGEILRHLPALANTQLWIVKPPQGLSTPQVYGRLKANELLQRNPESTLEGFLQGKPEYYNDLEMPAFAALPELAILKQQLIDSGFHTVLMSGSGTSFFCMGSHAPLKISGLAYFSCSFISRQAGSWF